MGYSNPFSPVNWDTIREKVRAYHRKYNKIAAVLDAAGGTSPTIDKKKEYLQFYIDKEALCRLNTIAGFTDCAALGVFFGLDEIAGGNKVTACFLGVDAKGQIIKEHKGVGEADGPYGQNDQGLLMKGEDQWPPPYDTTVGPGTAQAGVQIPSTQFLTLDDPEEKVLEFFNGKQNA